MKSYRSWAPEQPYLFPPSPLDWLPEGHLVFFLMDVLGGLDLSEIEAAIQAKDGRGTQPYHPRMMVGLLLYGYCVGIASSRRLERASVEDVAFRVLCAGNNPDHTVISEFRRKHLHALRGLFVQMLRLCQAAGLVKLGHVALDGTKVRANASKHKAMSRGRMLKSESQLQREIESLLARAEQIDREEDERFGKDKRGDELPEELRRREGRLEKIREAKARLEAEAARARAAELAERAKQAKKKAERAEKLDRTRAERRAKRAAARASKGAEKALECSQRWVAMAQEHVHAAGDRHQRSRAEERLTSARCEQEKAARLASDPTTGRNPLELPEHRVEADKHGDPRDRSQMNFTDPDSRIMKSGSDFMQAYNCQAAVDAEHQIIVGQAVGNQAPDQEHLQPLLEQVVAHCGAAPAIFTAYAGYYSEANAFYCEKLETDAYISTARHKHGNGPPPTETLDAEPAGARARMQRKLQSEPGRRHYARRKAIVEAPFGQIKQGRGFRQFLLRGTEKVRAEWALVCAGHNLLKLFRATAPT